MAQTLEAVVQRLDNMDERRNREELRRPRKGRGVLRREDDEIYNDQEGEDEVLMGDGRDRGRGQRVIHEREVSEERKVRFVKMKLKGPACAWWSSVEEQLRRTHQPSIIKWEEMKGRLKTQYLPVNYEQIIYDDMLQLRQGGKISKPSQPVDISKGGPVIDWKEKSKAFSEGPQCFKCKGFDHFAVVCPTRDNDSEMNVISGEVAEPLGLRQEIHPTPYRISWINDTVQSQSSTAILLNFHWEKGTQMKSGVMLSL
ncbi:hypothetical protein JRO89_XS05G0249400 [Xanthoceras sorbifolium]|uniref:Retrotransposon gag domain-containing protein n=1 Tax=Xanthoceras sorbifolium TaxID=99658 RepID=A0ABQ8I3R4_9ROSI|nr:hypothetical protein JRO89_XS05G0249400 [Xanthoceras sorbifolium]